MKKLAIFFAITIITVCGVYYIYLNYKTNYNTAKRNNLEFEKYLNQEISGSDLATLINKAIDNNKKFEIQTNKKGYYENDNNNSINIDIKMIDNDTVYKMETIYNKGIQNFVNYYSKINFKCTKVEYHTLTNKIKYMLFEQITE